MATSKTTTKKTITKKVTSKTKTTTKKAPVKKVAPKKVTPKKATEMVNVDSSSLLDALLPPPQKGVSNKKSAVIFDDLPSSVKEHNEKVTAKKTTTKVTKKAPTKKTTTKKETSSVDAKRNEKKLKSMSKEEKQMYKKLWEHFNYIANLTMVIEEKMMDPKQITDLTIGEMHVLETVENNILSEKLLSIIKKVLSEREYKIVCMRYGIGSTPAYTQREIAKKLNISRSYISRLEKKAIDIMKDYVKKNEVYM